MYVRFIVGLGIVMGCGWAARAQDVSSTSPTVVDIRLAEGLEVRKSFIRVDLLASAKGPDLERLQSEIEQSVEPFKSATVKSGSTAIILGDRIASVSSLSDGAGAGGPFWTLQQRVIIQGLDQSDVLSFAQRPRAGVEISSINYSVPFDLQKKTESDVTDLVLKNLAARAETVMKSLGGKTVDITNIRILTNLQSDDSRNQPPSPGGISGNDQGTGKNPPGPSLSEIEARALVEKSLSSATAVISADISATFVVKR